MRLKCELALRGDGGVPPIALRAVIHVAVWARRACDRMNKWPIVWARRLIGHLFIYAMRKWQITLGEAMIGHLFMRIG